MARKLANWLESYMTYAECTEAPKLIHFWAGVSAVAGALRRRVWFDQIKFKWYPSFFIIFVGPPGVITKSTTADGSMDLLREVPGIHFGPDSVTWQQLVASFEGAVDSFEIDGNRYIMSAITLLASEFGTLMDFQDNGMVNLFITLWDGRNRYEKQTKSSGNDMVEGPWLNLLACTTPQWIAANMNATTIGGGFTSRCVFVYGDKKERPIAYIKRAIAGQMEGYGELRANLVHDLEHIAVTLKGEYVLTPEAEDWGHEWYEHLWASVYKPENEDYVNNYLSRKQAHMHKLGIVLAAAQRDERIITLKDLRLAEIMLNQTEDNFKKIFRSIGKTDEAQHADIILRAIQVKKEMPYQDLVRISQAHFPSSREFESILKMFIEAGYVKTGPIPGGGTRVIWTGEDV